MQALPNPSAPPSRSEVKALVEEVKAGKPASLNALRALAVYHPALVVEETHADLASLARTALMHATFKDDMVLREGLRVKLRLLAAELAGDNPSPARRLCVEAVAFAWGEHWWISTLVAANQHSTPAWLRRQSGAHRRLMSSLKTLAQLTAAERPVRRSIFEEIG